MRNSYFLSAIAILSINGLAPGQSAVSVKATSPSVAVSPRVAADSAGNATFGLGSDEPRQLTISTALPTDSSTDPCAFGREKADCPSCPHIWARAEYLLWWLSASKLPPLVTTSPPGTPQIEAGVLGAPGTTVLFGGAHENGDVRSGGRFTLGGWLGCDQCLGIEGSFFILEGKGAHFSANSNGNPILARPFTDATTGLPNSELIAFPGVVAGSINANDVSKQFLGAGVLLRHHICCGCNYFVDAVAGYRYLYYSQGISVTEDLMSTLPSTSFPFIPFGTTLFVGDRFATRNSFNGFDMGLTGEFRRGPWSLEWLAKVALGGTFTALDINGETTVTVPGLPSVTSPGGLLALSSNSGHFTRERFSAVPEFGIRLGYDITPHIRTTLGYTIFWWDPIGDATKSVDLNVNTNLLPPAIPGGSAAPALLFGKSTLVGQGLDLGLEIRF
jgi:hypothetical protein